MRSYFYHSPKWLQYVYPDLVWKITTSEKCVFLTFDDGPDEVATEFVLDQLKKYSAKATFFCIGEKIRKEPDIFLKILGEGHGFGNHTYHHLNGWKTADETYLADIRRFEDEIEKISLKTKLFRPPYGRIRKKQVRQLKDRYKIIMWSHMAGDFDKKLHLRSSQKSLLKGEAGSILLFHDSFGAYQNLKQLLPVVLDHYSNAGFTFKSLSEHAFS